jgi:hypothetical protein
MIDLKTLIDLQMEELDLCIDGVFIDSKTAQKLSLEVFAKAIIQECQRACENYINECGEVNGVPESVFNRHFDIQSA